jgi:hypothetical protein
MIRKSSFVPLLVFTLFAMVTRVAAQTNAIQLRTGGSNSTTLVAASSGGSFVLTLPGSSGADGNALITNGSGGLSWGTVSSATSLDGLTDAKSGGSNFANSLIIGHDSTGSPLSLASNNTAVGVGAMKSIVSGVENIAIGTNALRDLSAGDQNTALGAYALRTVTSGEKNTAVGIAAMQDGIGSRNTFVGGFAGRGWSFGANAGDDNAVLGYDALTRVSSGSRNSILGGSAGYDMTTASNNVIIGQSAGVGLSTGNGNVWIGYSVGPVTVGSYTRDTVSNTLFVDNTQTNSPLIHGNFNNDQLTLNGHVAVEIGTTNYTVPFSISGSGSEGAANVENAYLGTDVPTLLVRNTKDNDVTANAAAIIAVGGSGGGDAYISFDVYMVGGWSIGVDNSDEDKLKVLDGWDFRSDGGTGLPVMTMTRFTRRVGIGTETPAYDLDVVGDIRASGDVRSGANILTSDSRLKRNIQPIGNALAIVSQLRPVSYEKRKDLKSTAYPMKQIGFLAQELEQVLPDAVFTEQSPDAIKSVDYISLIGVLTRAMQEQQQRIETLEALVQELRDKK